MVSLSPGAKGDDGEVSSFKRPEVKWRELLCRLEAEARPGRAFLGQDLSVLLGCTEEPGSGDKTEDVGKKESPGEVKE